MSTKALHALTQERQEAAESRYVSWDRRVMIAGHHDQISVMARRIAQKVAGQFDWYTLTEHGVPILGTIPEVIEKSGVSRAPFYVARNELAEHGLIKIVETRWYAVVEDGDRDE